MDDLDFMYDQSIQDDFEDEFVHSQRRYKERAAAAFSEDLADLRRRRRDMQDRIFDVLDLNAEIEKAKSTLEQADIAFQKHATRFDNTDNCEDISSKKFINLDIVPEKTVPKTIKFVKIPNEYVESCTPQSIVKLRQDKMYPLIESNEIADPLNARPSLLSSKRKFLKRKKSVSF
ncbi:hypothetical protein ANTRET_LOCUS262 [Anthophora retusa]